MSDIDEIKLRLDIVDTVSGYVPLKKSGRYFKARCPFHTEKTPSFIVDPERQSWRCFGACATGGDLISFVKRIENLDFRETLNLLAQKANVTLSRRRDQETTSPLLRLNEIAVRFYRDVLESSRGKEALEYLGDRGVDSGARATFQLGLSPKGGNTLKAHIRELGVVEDQAVQAGLLHRNEGGETRDFFRGRLMFPIHDRQGRVTGFGARSLDGSDPKYLNTPATPVFDKRGTLYGLHLAADPMREQRTGIVVEGYMDVIAAHQHGFSNVVASMGTALTEAQVSQLRSAASKFVLALDPDAAGQEATLRSLESSWRALQVQVASDRHRAIGPLYSREQPNLGIAVLPPGRDPDALIREDREEWERLIREATPYMDYLLPAMASRFDLGTGQGKAQAADALFPLIAATDNPFDQERYFRKLADVLGVTVAALEASIGRPAVASRGPARGRGRRQSISKATEAPLEVGARHPLDEYILALLLQKPELKERVQAFAPDYFHQSGDREVFTLWLGCTTIDELRESLGEPFQERLDHLLQMELVQTTSQAGEAALRQCLQRLEGRHLQEMQEVLLSLEDAAVPPPTDLQETIVNVNSRLKELYSERS